ncbi:methyltransferase type 12 [Microbacterium mangrovi]|uniref:Methyltransferase type 12 n=1 Tax=Microbacterium mangrovi TaxID=1348253 RepID=A0A0B2A0W9_9MICO|nr:class I SAM-dependent methyltransferase [Microbacterium mangrovi]KHK97120.1 methyltransferase type 12 [Microbacterium mangrovi]
MTDYDPRIVDLYDLDNPDGPDHDFYRALADEAAAASVLDVGCGTGILTVTLARAGRRTVGIDPSPAMLDHARRRAGADAVEWVLGDSRSIPAGRFDAAFLAGNVAQHIPDPRWGRTLADLRGSIAPSAVLAFESRNPAARAWETWSGGDRTSRATPHGELVEWMEAAEVSPGVVELVAHNLFVATGEEVTETQLLTFRDRAMLEYQLDAAGFAVEAVFGDWNRTPFRGHEALMVFVARAA